MSSPDANETNAGGVQAFDLNVSIARRSPNVRRRRRRSVRVSLYRRILLFFFLARKKMEQSPLADLHEQFTNSLDNLENNRFSAQSTSQALPTGSKTFSDILASLQASLPPARADRVVVRRD